MTDTTNLTATRIKSLLRKAGFEASKKETTRVRGWHDYTAGYTVEAAGRNTAGNDLFIVGHKKDSLGRGVPVQSRAELIKAYREVLIAASLSAEVSEDGQELWVSQGA